MREGSEYLINGRKWWTSGARDPRCKVAESWDGVCHHGLLQVAIFMGKTDVADVLPSHMKQSMIIVPMDAKGVQVPQWRF